MAGSFFNFLPFSIQMGVAKIMVMCYTFITNPKGVFFALR